MNGGSTNIFRSRYIAGFGLLILLLSCGLYFMSNYTASADYSTKATDKLIGENFETVFPLGKYSEIYIADSEKGLFLVQQEEIEEDVYDLSIVSGSGEALYEVPEGCVYKQAGRSFIVKTKTGWRFISLDSVEKTGQFIQEEYDSAMVPPSGNYALVSQNGRYFVCDTEGWQFYEMQKYKGGETAPFLADKEGYIVESDEEGNYFIVNMETGLTEYEAPEGVAVYQYKGGMWAMDFMNEGTRGDDSFHYYYLLDDEYQLTADGAVVSGSNISWETSDKYLSVRQEKDTDYDTRERMHSREYDIDNTYTRVYRNDGRLVYDAVSEEDYEGEFGSRIRYIKGDILATSGQNEQYIDYIDLETGKVIVENSRIFSFMDHEDGAAAACRCKMKSDYDFRGGALLLLKSSMDNYEWALVDENLQPLTEFVFDGIYPGDNGYAVIMKDNQKGLIRLKGVS